MFIRALLKPLVKVLNLFKSKLPKLLNKLLEYFTKVLNLFKNKFPKFFELLQDVKETMQKHSDLFLKFFKIYFFAMFVLFGLLFGVLFIGYELPSEGAIAVGVYIWK